MKKLLFIILTCSSLFSASIYTLDNVKNLNIYFANKSGFLEKEQKNDISKSIKKELEKAGFIFGKADSVTFFVKVQAKEIDDAYIINIQLGIAEDVITKRKDNIETFSFTYLRSELIESDEPYEDTVDMINFLLNEFIVAHKDDNEE